MKNTFVQKVYVSAIILLLVGVLGMQQGKIFGYQIFKSDQEKSKAATFTIDDIKKIFDKATSFDLHNDTVIVLSEKGKIGWVYNSSPVSDSIVGYTSSVPLLLGFDLEDHLVGTIMLQNYESPDFVEKIEQSGFMESWNGMPLSKILNSDIDAFSGATLTSTAIINTISHSVNVILKQSGTKEKKVDYVGVIKIVLGYLLLVMAVLQFFFSQKMKKFRMGYQISVVLILGFWLGTFLSLFSFQNWVVHGISISSKLFVFIILILSIVLPLVTSKSFYCSHLCPFGASQDLLGKIKKERVKLPNNVKHFLSTLREKVFAVIMLLLFTGVSLDLTNIEPFSAFLFRSASLPIIILAVLFLLLSIFIPRPWCNYACPTGYILETIRKPFKTK